MKILVTGGSGYIGSHTIVELLNTGYEVIAVDNLSNSYEWIIGNIELVSGRKPVFYKTDLCNIKETEKIFQKHNDILGVIHFAAFKAVGESVLFPNKYYYNNLVSLINLLELMRKYSVKYLVFSSSCTVYGQPEQIPITEDAPVQKAESPYGNTKQISEEIIIDNVRAGNLRAISLRYFNPIGAHMTGLLGELPIGAPENLMPVITQTCIGKQGKFYIWGDDYPTPDGTCIRDYIHVSDLATAHIRAFEYFHKQTDNYSVFNLGSEKGYSVKEIISQFEKVNKVKLNYEIGPRRQGDVVQIYADSSKARKLLGWKTEKTLNDMVLSAWKWEQYLAQRIP